jgi:hypothetical protein
MKRRKADASHWNKRYPSRGQASNHRIIKARWSWGCVSAIDSNGRTIWIADAHRGDGKRFIVRADDILTGFLELETAITQFAVDAMS